MELEANDLEILKAATQLVWAKGIHNPQESNIANALTQLTERALKAGPKPMVPPKEPMLKNSDEKKGKG